MKLIELIFLATGLSMDAFAVAVCKGLAQGRVKIKCALMVGVYFGVFQALMPTIGYFIGMGFRGTIEAYDHWVIFCLLAFLGTRMIIEALSKGTPEDEENASASLDAQEMLLLALATSIDALAAGLSLAFLRVNIALSASLIGIITFVLSTAGVYIGGIFGGKYKKAAEFVGGAVLLTLGVKILIEHLLHV